MLLKLPNILESNPHPNLIHTIVSLQYISPTQYKIYLLNFQNNIYNYFALFIVSLQYISSTQHMIYLLNFQYNIYIYFEN